MPTLTAHTQVILRYLKVVDGEPAELYLRELEGWEYMLAIGWDPDMFAEQDVDRSLYNKDFLKNLAGNAFSAYALVPLFTAHFAWLGQVMLDKAAKDVQEVNTAAPACDMGPESLPSEDFGDTLKEMLFETDLFGEF